MFYVTTIDGDILLEGRDVDHWEAIPQDTQIISVTLTDGMKIHHTISGYDRYVVCYVGESILSQSAQGGVAPTMRTEPVGRQIAYGIRDTSRAIKNMISVVNSMRVELRNLKVDSVEFPAQREYLIGKINAAESRVRERIMESACVRVELNPVASYGPLSSCDQAGRCMRQGVQDDSDIVSIDDMKTIIRKEID